MIGDVFEIDVTKDSALSYHGKTIVIQISRGDSHFHIIDYTLKKEPEISGTNMMHTCGGKLLKPLGNIFSIPSSCFRQTKKIQNVKILFTTKDKIVWDIDGKIYQEVEVYSKTVMSEIIERYTNISRKRVD